MASRAHARMLGRPRDHPAPRTPRRSMPGWTQIAEELASGEFVFRRGGRGHPHGGRAPPDRDRRRRRAAPAHRAQPQRPGGHRHAPATCASTRRARSRPLRGAGRGAARSRPRRTSTRSCPATRTASAPSRCAWPTTCWPTCGCSGRDRARLGHAIEPRATSARWAAARCRASASRSTASDGGRELGFAPPSPNSLDAVGEPRRADRLPALRRAARRAPLAPGRPRSSAGPATSPGS